MCIIKQAVQLVHMSMNGGLCPAGIHKPLNLTKLFDKFKFSSLLIQ